MITAFVNADRLTRRPTGPFDSSASDTAKTLDMEAVEFLAERYQVPVEDVLLIAVNLHGISSDQNRHRARVTLRLASQPLVPWLVIVPLNAARSPFTLRDERLCLGQDL